MSGFARARRNFLITGFAVLALLTFTQSGAAADIKVGPLETYKTVTAGVAAAHANDRVIIAPGLYADDSATISVPITIEGAAPGVILRATSPLANRKGILVVNADLIIRNITLDGAQNLETDGGNGAGIRLQGGSLTVDTCTFSSNQNGILADANLAAAITVTGSTFIDNGSGTGYTHAIYAGHIKKLTVTSSTFNGTRVGHDIKSRARETVIKDTVLDDGITGTSSYAIDLPNGGVALIDNVRITQGTRTNNPAMIAYGAEGDLPAANSLSVLNSTFVNSLRRRSVAIYNFAPKIAPNLVNNSFQNVATIVRVPK